MIIINMYGNDIYHINTNNTIIMQKTPKQSPMQIYYSCFFLFFIVMLRGADDCFTSLSVMLHRNQCDSCYINMEMFF